MVGKKLIICEGGDDVGLLNRFLEKLGYQRNDFEIMSMGGKSFLLNRNDLKYIVKRQQIETGQYSKVLFVVDADYSKNDAIAGGHVNTEAKIIELIAQLEIKEVADYFISCDPEDKNGNLEHLLLSSVEQDKRSCIENFIGCIQGMNAESNKKIVYAAYQAIFKEAPYNFDHLNFDELKQKIEWLFS